MREGGLQGRGKTSVRSSVLARIERASAARLRIWICAMVVIVMAGMISHGNYAATGDAPHYMMIAHSVAFDRDLALANDYDNPANILQLKPGLHARVGDDGVLRPAHDVGFPVMAAPFFAAAYRLAELTDRLPESLRRRAKLTPYIALRQLVSLFMIGLTALLAVVFFHVAWRLTGRKAVSFLWTILWALSPPILSHGYVFFTEIPSALVALFVYARLDDLRGDRPVQRGAVLGALTGFLFLIHVRNIGLILALILLAAWRVRHEHRRGIGFAAGLCVMGAVKVALNLRFWGTIVTTPHEHFAGWPGAAAFFSEMTVRAGGLLFDARHGLLLSAPIYLLAPAAWILLRRRSRAGRLVSQELLLLAAAYLLFLLMPVTNVHGWRGGWSPAARYLVPIVPWLAMAVPGLAAQGLAGACTGVIVAIQLVVDAFFWGHPMQFWTVGPGPAPFLQALIGSRIAALVPAWAGLNAATLLVLLAGLTLWGALTWVLVREAGHERRAEPAAVAYD